MLKNIGKNMITTLLVLVAISGLSFASDDFGAAATSGKEEFTLEEMLNYALEDDVKEVFERLKAASEKHLKAFERQVGRGSSNSRNDRGLGRRF